MSDYIKDISDLCNIYNRNLKFLARAYSTLKKGTFDHAQTLRNNSRLSMICEKEPLFFIEVSGPFLVIHAETIRTRDWDTFKTLDFTREKAAYKAQPDGADKTDERMNQHIKFITKMIDKVSDAERKACGDALNEMLGIYCSYVLRVKEEQKKKG